MLLNEYLRNRNRYILCLHCSIVGSYILSCQFYFLNSILLAKSSIITYVKCLNHHYSKIFFLHCLCWVKGGGQVKNECPLVFSSGVCGVNIGFLIHFLMLLVCSGVPVKFYTAGSRSLECSGSGYNTFY